MINLYNTVIKLISNNINNKDITIMASAIDKEEHEERKVFKPDELLMILFAVREFNSAWKKFEDRIK